MLRLTVVCLTVALALMTRLIHAQTMSSLDPTAPLAPLPPLAPPTSGQQQGGMPNLLQMMLLRKMFDNWALPAMMMYGGNQQGGSIFPLWAMWNMF